MSDQDAILTCKYIAALQRILQSGESILQGLRFYYPTKTRVWSCRVDFVDTTSRLDAEYVGKEGMERLISICTSKDFVFSDDAKRITSSEVNGASDSYTAMCLALDRLTAYGNRLAVLAWRSTAPSWIIFDNTNNTILEDVAVTTK